MSDIIDFDRLTAPIEGENPAGPDLREDYSPTAPYQRIKDARAAARAAERTLDENGQPGEAPDEWRRILDLAPDLLAEQSKDLEVCCYLIEGLLRRDGFAGLRDGFKLARLLIETYWDTLYPLPDEDGIETRVRPIVGLNGEGVDGTLIAPMRKVELTMGTTQGPFAFWQFEQARTVGALSQELQEARIATGQISPEMVQTAVRETPANFFVETVASLDAARSEFDLLMNALSERCGDDTPSGSNIRNCFEQISDTIRFAARDVLATVSSGQESDAADGGAVGVTAGGRAAGGGSDAISTREDAFRLVLKAADYFRRMEPHSPLAYTLEESVRRGRLSLQDLLAELIRDETARRDFLIAAGIQPKEE